MEYSQNIINAGITNGLGRVLPHFRRQAEYPPDYLRPLLENVLGSWPGESQDRFILLFAELATVAAIARIANQEPRLTHDDVNAFLAHSISFFNSFTHR